MGSVQSSVECPVCKNEAIEDYYYKSGETWISCHSCGYYYERWLARSTGNNIIKNDDGTFKYKTAEIKVPRGCVAISAFNTPTIAVNHLEDTEAEQNFRRWVKKGRKRNAIKRITINYYDYDKQKCFMEVLYSSRTRKMQRRAA